MTIVLLILMAVIFAGFFCIVAYALKSKEILTERIIDLNHDILDMKSDLQAARDALIEEDDWNAMVEGLKVLDERTRNLNSDISSTVNEYVGEALDNVDFDLESYNVSINNLIQTYGKLKERMDKLCPEPRKPIDPVENIKRQGKLMDAMIKDTTDAYAEALKKRELNEKFGVASKKNSSDMCQEVVKKNTDIYVELSDPTCPPTIITQKESNYSPDIFDEKLVIPQVNDNVQINFPVDPEEHEKIVSNYAKKQESNSQDHWNKYMNRLNEWKAAEQNDIFETTQIPTFANSQYDTGDVTEELRSFFTSQK